MRKAKRSFQDWKEKNMKSVDLTGYEWQELEHRLGNATPIKPCDVFTLDSETALSSRALLLTYTIILIQFRLND